MAEKVPQGYRGTYGTAADGSPVLIMASRSEYAADEKTTKKELKPMSEQQQQGGAFVPYTTEQKKEYAKQFTKREIASYRKGQQSAYGHMGNIGKRNSLYIYNNLQKDNTATPPPAPPSDKPKPAGRKNNGNK